MGQFFYFLTALFCTQYVAAQIIVYEGSFAFKNVIPDSDNINHALLKEAMPERIHEQKVFIVKNKLGYSYSRPSPQTPSIAAEGRWQWINYDTDVSYSHKQGNFSPPSLDIVATKETKTICGYECKKYYNVYDYKGKTDTCFFGITDKLPNKISPNGSFNNNQKIKGAILAEKSPFFTWEAIMVEKCDKIDKKLFDWSLHPNNVNSEQLKKYVPCKF